VPLICDSDPRIAIHSHSVDPPEGNPGACSGEAKLFGCVEELTGHERASDRFRVNLEQVVPTWLDSPVLAIKTWTPERGVVRSERD
jgi:hypothetical protein